MAVFQYGAVITRISGSIGGTNFRLFRGMPVISNKSQGGSYQVRLQNKKLGQLAWLFREFHSLDPTSQLAWQSLSNNYTFPDKFGKYRIISGRQFYTKMNAQLLPVKQYNRDATAFDPTLNPWSLKDFTCNLTGFNCMVEINTVGANNYFLYQLEFSTKKLNSPQFTRRLIFGSSQSDVNFTVNVYPELYKAFPTVRAGDNVRLYVWQMSKGGLRDTPLYIDVVAF